MTGTIMTETQEQEVLESWLHSLQNIVGPDQAEALREMSEDRLAGYEDLAGYVVPLLAKEARLRFAEVGLSVYLKVFQQGA